MLLTERGNFKMYKNEQLPALVRSKVEQAVTALVDHEKVILWSSCDANNLDHIALAAGPLVYDAIVEHLFTDEALADAKVLNIIKTSLSRLQQNAALWLATAAREKYPKGQSKKDR